MSAYTDWLENAPARLRQHYETELSHSARPAALRRLFERLRFGMAKCYRSKVNPRWHFQIRSVDENQDGTFTLTLIHGNDSTMPGVSTFGQPPRQLMICDCGNWRRPTAKSIKATHERLEALATFKRLERAVETAHKQIKAARKRLDSTTKGRLLMRAFKAEKLTPKAAEVALKRLTPKR